VQEIDGTPLLAGADWNGSWNAKDRVVERGPDAARPVRRRGTGRVTIALACTHTRWFACYRSHVRDRSAHGRAGTRFAPEPWVARPLREVRRSVVDATLTLRLTQQDRELLQELVALKAAELVDTGMEATAASYVRGLIRHEARAKGLLTPAPEATRASVGANGSNGHSAATAEESRGHAELRAARRR
jgi:hypothetical protein